MSNVNLLEETIRELKSIGKKEEDILWVGTRDGKYYMEWEKFKELAKNINYDAGYGIEYIRLDLVIVFKDGSWLERASYDGSEWWEYKKTPQLKEDAEKINHEVMIKEFDW